MNGFSARTSPLADLHPVTARALNCVQKWYGEPPAKRIAYTDGSASATYAGWGCVVFVRLHSGEIQFVGSARGRVALDLQTSFGAVKGTNNEAELSAAAWLLRWAATLPDQADLQLCVDIIGLFMC